MENSLNDNNESGLKLDDMIRKISVSVECFLPKEIANQTITTFSNQPYVMIVHERKGDLF